MGYAQMAGHGLGMEVVEGAKAGHHRGQGSGYVRIAGVGVVVLSVDAIAMDFGVERLRHLAGGAAEVHKKAAGGYAVESESMLREPLGDLADVFARRPELRAELLGCQPAVKVRRLRIVLPPDELLQGLLLRLTAPQHHKDVFLGQAIGRPALVKLWPRTAADVAGEPAQAIVIRLRCDPVRSSGSTPTQSREHSHSNPLGEGLSRLFCGMLGMVPTPYEV